MREFIFQALESRWWQVFDEYTLFKQKAEAQVTSHQWTSAERYSLRPLYFERYPGRGRLLNEQPKDASLLPHAYGFDEQDQVVLHRRYHPLYPPIETFYIYLPHMVELITYSSHSGKAIPGAVERYFYEGEHLIHYAQWMLNGYGPGAAYQDDYSPDTILKLFRQMGVIRVMEDYHYEGEHLVKIRLYHSGMTAVPHITEQTVSYDEKGNVQRIDEVAGDNQRVVYQKKGKTETIKTLAEKVKAQLLKAIPQVIAAQKFQEPIYCLLLNYGYGDQYFPLSLTVGWESWREQVVEQQKDQAPALIWLPMLGDATLLEITDPEVIATCERLEYLIEEKFAVKRARPILIELAQALMQLDWAQITPVTADFVVFPLDAEIDDIKATLRKIAPPEQVRQWKAKGWL